MIRDFVFNVHDEFLERPVRYVAFFFASAVLAFVLCSLTGCGPTDPATRRADCIEDCSDFVCDTSVQPQACEACLANCKTIGYDR